MITNQQVAGQVSQRVLEVNRLLNDALLVVSEKCPEEEASAFRLAIGQVLGELLLAVINPLYRQHPALKPDGLDVR